MTRLRRSLASCALCVALLQVVLLLSASVLPCCAAAAAGGLARADENGAHAHCPMHESAPTSQCRLTCGHHPVAGLTLLPAGTLTSAAVLLSPDGAGDTVAAPRLIPISAPAVPVPPPPEA